MPENLIVRYKSKMVYAYLVTNTNNFRQTYGIRKSHGRGRIKFRIRYLFPDTIKKFLFSFPVLALNYDNYANLFLAIV